MPVVVVGDRIGSAVVQPLLELGVEIGSADPQHLLNGVGRADEVCKRMHHFEQLTRAPLVLDVVADPPGLEVRHEYLRGELRVHEPFVEIGNRQ